MAHASAAQVAWLGVTVCVWYGAHAHSVVESARLLRDLHASYPYAHVTLTAVQLNVGVLAALGYLAVSTRLCGEAWAPPASSGDERLGLKASDADTETPLDMTDDITEAEAGGALARTSGCTQWLDAGTLALLAAASACNTVGIGGTNASMVLLGSTHTQVLKASEPIYTALLKWLILRSSSSHTALGALTLIASGCALISLKTARADAAHGGPGVALAALPVTLACISLPLMRILTKTDRLRVLLGGGAHTLLALNALPALPALACAGYVHALHGTPPIDRRFFTSAIALNTYMLASLSVLRTVDAVSHAVANAFKRIFIITVSGIFFKDALDTRKLAGLGLAFVGIVVYGEALAPPVQPRRLAQRLCALAVPPLCLLWLSSESSPVGASASH